MVLPLGVTQAVVSEAGRPEPAPLPSCAQVGLPVTIRVKLS